jgi:hypothetical protein
LRHCATSRKVAGSISDKDIGFLNLSNPFSRTIALRYTQPVTEMRTRNLLGCRWRPALEADFTAIYQQIFEKKNWSHVWQSNESHGLLIEVASILLSVRNFDMFMFSGFLLPTLISTN